jgi:hypothetical protein
MTALYPQTVDTIKPTIGELRFQSHFVNIGCMTIDAQPYAEIGSRLLRLRTGLSDLSQKAWAEKHGFNPTQYNNWEKGVRRIPVDSAEALCERYSLTLDAIYRGRMFGLPEALSKIL